MLGRIIQSNVDYKNRVDVVEFPVTPTAKCLTLDEPGEGSFVFLEASAIDKGSVSTRFELCTIR